MRNLLVRPRGPTWIVLVPLLTAWACSVGTVAAQEAPEPNPALEAALLQATNAARAEHGLAPLSADPGLARAALLHAAENAQRRLLDHGSPYPERATVAQRVALAGVALVRVGENLAFIVEEDVARESVAGWLTSPTHRANLLEPDFTHVGFGTVATEAGTYVTQLLGARPLKRDRATAIPIVLYEREWRLRLEGSEGTGVTLFLDGRPVEQTLLRDGTAEVRLFVQDDAPRRLQVGVAIGGGSYRAADDGTLDPLAGWTRQAGTTPSEVQVAAADFVARDRHAVTLEVAYDPDSADDSELVLFADGTHLPEVVAENGVLRLTRFSEELPNEVAVGVTDGSGSARLLERFTVVRTDDGAQLVPGRPDLEVLAGGPPPAQAPPGDDSPADAPTGEESAASDDPFADDPAEPDADSDAEVDDEAGAEASDDANGEENDDRRDPRRRGGEQDGP